MGFLREGATADTSREIESQPAGQIGSGIHIAVGLVLMHGNPNPPQLSLLLLPI